MEAVRTAQNSNTNANKESLHLHQAVPAAFKHVNAAAAYAAVSVYILVGCMSTAELKAAGSNRRTFQQLLMSVVQSLPDCLYS
jgi:hypothetical protein